MSEAHILADVDMARGERFELGGGEAVVLSLAKPGRDGPNEDAAAVISLGEQAGVAVVSDGAGGHPSGAKAAALAVRAVCDAVVALGGDLENLRGAIINGFESADRAISKAFEQPVDARALALGGGADQSVRFAAFDASFVGREHVHE